MAAEDNQQLKAKAPPTDRLEGPSLCTPTVCPSLPGGGSATRRGGRGGWHCPRLYPGMSSGRGDRWGGRLQQLRNGHMLTLHQVHLPLSQQASRCEHLKPVPPREQGG
nr:MAG TPA: hypothetical protein [Caudoviricetes sp.]